MSYPGYHAGQVDITHGLAGPATFPRHHGGADAAEAAALAAIRSTPQYHQLVNQYRYHMAGQNGGAPPAPAPDPSSAGSYGGPGAAYGGTPHVKERELRDIREFSLGFKQTAIPAGGQFNVTSRPQVIFRGERLVIPDSPAWMGGPMITDDFDLLDLKVGNRSQLVEATSLPARAFAENAVGVRLALDTASIAQDIVISVESNDTTSATFKAIIFGTAAQ